MTIGTVRCTKPRRLNRALSTLWALATLLLFATCGGRTMTGWDGALGPDAAATDAAGAQDASQADAATEADSGASDSTVSDGTVPDAGTGTCASVGGTCMAMWWDMCAAGQEPYGNDDPLDCNGRCCVPAPASTCSAAMSGNCLLGPQCQGCWLPAMDTTLTCEPGRVCCEWMCD